MVPGEPFGRDARLAGRVTYPADKHRLADRPDVGADAELVAYRRKARIRRNQKIGLDHSAIGKGHGDAAAPGLNALHRASRAQIHIRLSRNAFEQRPAQMMVRHKMAKRPRVAGSRIDPHRKPRPAAQHLGAVKAVNVRHRDPRPGIQVAQRALGPVPPPVPPRR